MKVFDTSNCSNPDFSTIESNQILTTSVGRDGLDLNKTEVLIGLDGNVLTMEGIC